MRFSSSPILELSSESRRRYSPVREGLELGTSSRRHVYTRISLLILAVTRISNDTLERRSISSTTIGINNAWREDNKEKKKKEKAGCWIVAFNARHSRNSMQLHAQPPFLVKLHEFKPRQFGIRRNSGCLLLEQFPRSFHQLCFVRRVSH